MIHPARNNDPTDRRAPAEAARWLPADSLPCVWMTAGVLAYRLCDREYDCGRCPLDAALSGQDREPLVTRPQPPRSRSGLGFPGDRLYHVSHGWVLPRSAARLRYGLDMFAARLLDRTSAVVLPPDGGRLRRGHPACWLEDGGELTPFRSPVDGTVVATNARVRLLPGLIASSPYEEGWLLEVRRDEKGPDDDSLLTAERMRERTAVQLRELRRLRREALARDARVGATLADGGLPLTDLRRIVGTRRYRRLVADMLG